MNRNILFIFNTFPGIGGLETVSNNIIEYLGRDNTIYTLSFQTTKDAPASRYIKSIFHFESHNLANNIALFNKIIEDNNITHVINQGIYPHISHIIFNPYKQKELKVISVLHGMPLYEKKQYWQLPYIVNANSWKKRKREILAYFKLNKRYNRYIKSFSTSYREACINGDRIVVLCKEYINPFVNSYNLNKYKEKIIAIENPLSPLFSNQKEVEWRKKKNQVLFVGRLSKEKQVDIILDVWQKTKNATDWELVIVGDGEMREALEKIVADRQIQRVTFIGQTNKPEKYYELAKIILLTSSFEGFPMCLLEAIRFGVIPITFNISEGVQSIVDQSGGCIIEDHNPTTMAAKLTEITNNEELLHSASKQARLKSNRYTIEQIGRQWNNLLIEV